MYRLLAERKKRDRYEYELSGKRLRNVHKESMINLDSRLPSLLLRLLLNVKIVHFRGLRTFATLLPSLSSDALTFLSFHNFPEKNPKLFNFHQQLNFSFPEPFKNLFKWNTNISFLIFKEQQKISFSLSLQKKTL